MKKIASALLFAALAALLFFLAGQKAPPSSASDGGDAPKTAAARPFHELERKGLPSPSPDPACAGCHKGAPHKSDRRTRAFLNQHASFFTCLGCHTSGAGVTLARHEEDGRITASIGGAAAAAPTVSGSTHTLSGARFVERPGDCKSCHSRASGFFKANSFYNEYRQRLLEDLDVLALMENGL